MKMDTLQEPQGTGEARSSLQVSHDSQNDQQSNPGCDVHIANASGTPISSNENNKKISREDIELVQNLIEQCLLLYMNRNEVVAILKNRARIEPGFTSLVWQKLEEENAEFFRAYYIRLKLKKQILLFNNLLEHQHHLMKHPAAPKVSSTPMQNGVQSLPVNNVPMGYPVLQQHTMPVTGHPHLDSTVLSSCHVVSGVPAPGNFHPMHVNSGNELMDGKTTDAIHAALPSSSMLSMSEMAVSSTSVAPSGHFPFAPSDIQGIGLDSSMLHPAFTSDVGTTGLQLGLDGAGFSKETLISGGELPWNFSLSDLTADLTNMGDLGALGNYTGSPFLPDTDMPDTDQDDIVEEYFIDDINEPFSPSDEEKP